MPSKLRGLILAAGSGTRLAPITITRSKPLVPLANKPLIEYSIEKLTDAGIDEIGIVVGSNAQELRDALEGYPANLSFIRQVEPRGLANAVESAKDFCADGDFVLLFCDNLFMEPLAPAIEYWRRLRAEAIPPHALIHTVEAENPRACGVAVLNADGDVLELEEKPAEPKSNLAVVGLDIFTPRIFEAIPRIKPSRRGELEITDAMSELIRLGHRVAARSLSGFWYDTGTFADLLNALGPVLRHLTTYSVQGRIEGCEITPGTRGMLGLGPGSLLRNCKINGPVVVGRDCVIENCTLGPDVSIADNCKLLRCRLKRVIAFEGLDLKDAASEGCIYSETAAFSV